VLPGKKYLPEDFIRLAWRRKWFIVAPFVIATIGAAVYGQLLPDRYRSDTLILVVPQRVPDSYVRSTVTTPIEQRLQSIREQILSRTRLETIIRDLDLYKDARETRIMEDIVQGMRNDINIQVVRGDAFRVSYVSDSARTAMQVAERIGSSFIEENLRDRAVQADSTNQFLESQLQDTRRRLLEQERRVEDYKRRYTGQLPSQLESNLQVLQNVQLQIQAVVESINQDRNQRLVLERSLADGLAVPDESPSISPPVVIDPTDPVQAASGSAQQTVESLKTALRAMELRLRPEHPDIKKMKRIIEEAEKKAAAEALERPLSPGAVTAGTAAIPGAPGLSQAEVLRQNRIRGLRADIENLDRQIGRKQADEQRLREAASHYQARVEAAPSRESELVQLTRDYNTLQELYTTLLTKNEDAKLAANLERRQGGEQFRVIDPASLPQRPVSPNRSRINGMGAAAGLLFGLGLVALIEYRDRTLRTDDDVVITLSLPVLAIVPFMPTAAERIRQRRRVVALAVSAGAAAVVAAAAVVWRLRLYQ
jgi:polysaccharide chain length determinant protein (PEP-CTERM system associated)